MSEKTRVHRQGHEMNADQKVAVYQSVDFGGRTPQVCILSAQSWAILGPYFRLSGLLSRAEIPALPAGLPILDVENVTDDDAMAKALRQYCGVAGVANLPGLISALQAIGARLAYS